MLPLRLVLLTVTHFVLFIIVSGTIIPRTGPDSGDSGTTLLALAATSLLNTVVLAFVILRSQVTGWRLALYAFIVFFGVNTLMSQIETAVFVTSLPAGMLPRIVLAGFVFATLFCPIAVLLLGRFRSRSTGVRSRLPLMRSQWVIRVSLIAVCYIVIYFTFGYFVAWRNPAVREYYHGSDPGGFLTQLKSVAQSTPWLFPFQFLRGVLWVGLALPVIWMMRDRGWQTALAVALCFSVFTAALLLLPNPLMPTEVRMAHLIETASSNFLFGLLLVAILLHQPQRAVS